MSDRPPVRRRRRRRRRLEASPEATAAGASRSATALRPEEPARWLWLTFPVFFAFVAGAFLILLIAPEPNTALYTVLFFAFLGATAYGLIHILVRWYVLRRRRRR